MKNFKYTKAERIREKNAETAGLPKVWHVTLSDICGTPCFRFLVQLGLRDILGIRTPILTLTDGASVMCPKKVLGLRNNNQRRIVVV